MKIFDESVSTCAQLLKGIQCTEATVQALLYHSCLIRGISPQTICLEYQIGDHTLDRADLALFSDGYNGRFSWYTNADRTKPNEAWKAQHIRGIVEIKGGYHSERTALGKLNIWLRLFTSDTSSKKNPLSDINKLEKWKAVYPNLELAAFVCAAFPEERSIDNDLAVEQIGHICEDKAVAFYYIDSVTGETYKNNV